MTSALNASWFCLSMFVWSAMKKTDKKDEGRKDTAWKEGGQWHEHGRHRQGLTRHERKDREDEHEEREISKLFVFKLFDFELGFRTVVVP